MQNLDEIHRTTTTLSFLWSVWWWWFGKRLEPAEQWRVKKQEAAGEGAAAVSSAAIDDSHIRFLKVKRKKKNRNEKDLAKAKEWRRKRSAHVVVIHIVLAFTLHCSTFSCSHSLFFCSFTRNNSTTKKKLSIARFACFSSVQSSLVYITQSGNGWTTAPGSLASSFMERKQTFLLMWWGSIDLMEHQPIDILFACDAKIS